MRITTFDNYGTKVDEVGGLRLEVDRPATISDLSLTIDSGSHIISEKAGLLIDFLSPMPLY